MAAAGAAAAAAATLSQQEIKTLEQTRQRLFQLSNSLASLQHNILQADPLPPWTSLQSLASIISQNLSSVSAHLSTHSPLLSSMAVFPLETYPGKTQEGLLGQLLRKKLEPEVEDWVARGRHAAEEAGMGNAERREKMEELWSWAGIAANELARGHEWGGEFTREEREGEGGVESVVTGLVRRRRGLGRIGEDWEEEEEEEDEEGEEEGEGEDKMEIVAQADNEKAAAKGSEPKPTAEQEQEEKEKGEATTTTESKAPLPLPLPLLLPPPLSLEEVLKFLVTGIEPR